MGGNSIFHDGEAEACAAQFARAALVDAVEALEEMVEVLWFYAGAVVADVELDEMTAFMFILFADDGETRGTCGVGNDIVDEVAEDAVEQAGIAEDFYMAGYLERRGDALVVELQGGIVEDTLNDLQDIYLMVILT